MQRDATTSSVSAEKMLTPIQEATHPSLRLSEFKLTEQKDCSSHRIAEEARQRHHLESLSRAEIPPIVIVSGHSGSGKSFVIEELSESGIKASQRLVTRPKRDNDSTQDIAWQAHGDERPAFAYTKYGEHYGFPASDIVRTLKQGLGSAIVCGDLGKISPLIESLNSLMPHVPVIVIRLEVPLAVAQQRLMTARSEAYSGEAEIRNRYNHALEAWESRQTPTLKNLYDLHTVINLSAKEHQDQAYDSQQLKPLTAELIQELLERFREDAVASSKFMAEQILEPKHLSSQAGISDSLVTALDQHLLKTCELRGVTPVLKGGLAVAAYLSEASKETAAHPLTLNSERESRLTYTSAPLANIDRPVSPDIDWTMLPSEKNVATYESILTALSNSPVQFRDFNEKAVFKSHKASGAVDIAGEKIELDAISISRVQPTNQNFVFEFKYDSLIHHQHRELTLPSGRTAHLVAPEFLIVEKLCAGRGEELGKLDLSDAASLLITQPVDANLIQRMIASQKLHSELEEHFRSEVETPPPLSETAVNLRKLGIGDQKLINIVVERMLLSRQDQTIHEGMKFDWNFNSIKQIAFINSLLGSLHKIEEAASNPNDSSLGQKLTGTFKEEDIFRATSALKHYLYYYAEFQVGRSDVFVRRTRLDRYGLADS